MKMRYDIPALVILLAILAVLLLPGGASVAPQSAFAQIRAVTREIVAVRVDDGKKKGYCSGVMVAPDLLLTAAHCDLSRAPALKMTVNGQEAVLVRKDESRDIALLRVAAGCPCLAVIATPELDERVYVVGFPLDLGQVMTEGRYEGQAPDSDSNGTGMIIYTAGSTYGNSGGGVFVRRDGEWKLIGIVSRSKSVGSGFVSVPVPHLNLAAGKASIMQILGAS